MTFVLIILNDAALITIGLFLGHKLAKKLKVTTPNPAPKLVCSCNHARNMHLDKGEGRCNVTTTTFGKESGLILHEARCPCLFYVGPMPEPDPDKILQDFIRDNT
jgi:hypothetical protein